jgi:hypothetical protein
LSRYFLNEVRLAKYQELLDSPIHFRKMKPQVCFSFSDIFDRHPSMTDVIDSIRWIPLRHAVHVISYINSAVRYALMEPGRPNIGSVQELLVVAHTDDETLNTLKVRFPHAKCEDRPVYLPQSLLALLRVVIANCDPDSAPDPSDEEDKRVRYAISRACLMMNNLLFTPEEGSALTNAGTDDEKRIALMTQSIGTFELVNPSRPDHLMPRLQTMYRLLLNDPRVQARIAQECNGFDFLETFGRLVGMPLERWLFLIFAIYGYFTQGANAAVPQPEYLQINPNTFRGDSGISQNEFDIALESLSIAIPELKSALASETSTDPRHDLIAFRSKPLLSVEGLRLWPADLSFIVDKSHTGVHWTIHDLLSRKDRLKLFQAWGVLFEEYVHWLLDGMETQLLLKYVPRPKWVDTGDESFDGVLLQGGVFAPIECKGGFLLREARHSGSSTILLEEIEKKVVPGCDQLADKIGALFADDAKLRRELCDLPVDHVRAVVPILIVQDHILRVPFLNWHLNKSFQAKLQSHNIRTDIVVRPLTLINIHDLESVVHSIEGDDFDFVYAIHNRTIRDVEVLSDLTDYLRSFSNFGRKPSPRIKRILDEVQADWSSYLFPGINFREPPEEDNQGDQSPQK